MAHMLKNPDKLTLGVCYYPEQWNENLWESDLNRMKGAGITVCRVGEFAWSAFEPREGEFTSEYFTRFMDLAHKCGVGVIFGTPTATPPAWLTQAYPEVLNCDRTGTPYFHGARRHYNYNSPVYREKTEKIVTYIAKALGHHPALVGWQIDNELNCEMPLFFSPADDVAFRAFLVEKYHTIDKLNYAWGAAFWNQWYNSFSQVHIPKNTVNGTINPHQHLDYIRFISHSARAYCKLQSDILRKYSKDDVFITTNGLFGNLDSHTMTRESLDTFFYDSYPVSAFSLTSGPNSVGGPKKLRDRGSAQRLSQIRSIAPHFGIMEQQAGASGWVHRMESPAPKPGQLALWAMQSILHGADMVSFFRWRTATAGTEIYWHGILDYHNRDTRKIREVRELAEKIAAFAPIAGSDYVAQVAVLDDYDNTWDATIDTWHGMLERPSRQNIFAACTLSHTPLDYVTIDDDTTADALAKYKAVFYPHPAIMTGARARMLKEYVAQGGTLIVGARAGYKNTMGRCDMAVAPGHLSALCGVENLEGTLLGPVDETQTVCVDGARFEVGVYNDIMSPLPGTQVLATYETNYYAGACALAKKQVENGCVYTLGGTFSQEAAAWFLETCGVKTPHEAVVALPEDCELAVREKDGQRFYGILNYSKDPAVIELKQKLTDLETGKKLSGKVNLPGYGFAVYKA